MIPFAGGRPMKMAVLISGGGRTLKNLLELIARHQLNAQVCLVISSAAEAKGLDYASAAGVPARVFSRSESASTEAYSQAIFDAVRGAGAELVVMAGFLKLLVIPPDFENRVVNIHPALIPAFCGKGYFGHHVHQAVLDYGAKISGCTVHFVDNQYDHGPVILQRAVAVAEDDTADSLAARVFEAETIAYPEALQLIAQGRVAVDGRRVKIS